MKRRKSITKVCVYSKLFYVSCGNMDFPYYLCLVYIVKCMQSSMNSKVLLLCARRLMDKNANCSSLVAYN